LIRCLKFHQPKSLLQMEVEEEENTYIWEKKYVGAWEKIDEEIIESKEKGFFKKI
jgi:hypothetical protein